MAILWADSFDHYSTSELSSRYDSAPGSSLFREIDPDQGRFGTSSFAIVNVQNAGVQKIVGDNSTLVVGFAAKIGRNSAPDYLVPLLFMSGSSVTNNTQGALWIRQNGFVEYYAGDGTTLLASGPVELHQFVYAYFEVKVTFATSTGSIIVRVNENEIINQTNVNTNPRGTNMANRVALGTTLNGGNGRNLFIDDFYIEDSDFLGDVHIEALFPNAVGDASEWSPSTGGADNYTMTDDGSPDGDTTYVSGSAVGQKDTYGLVNPTVQYTDIKAIQVDFYERGEAGEGTPRVVPDLFINSTHYEGSLGLSTIETYRYRTEVIATNPDTASAWTKDDIDALEVGPKVKETF
jgi:hypothetical protein